jgi:hypothetical protein
LINLDIYRKLTRTTGIYFSGNTDPKIYDNNNITLRFGILTRKKIISTILNNIDTLDNILCSFNDNGKKNLIDNKIAINAWEWSISHSKNLNNRIDSFKWLEKLASCNFFICCPGIIIPFSHNAIEAMSVGTIPILQYSDLFDPPLINGINCISFNNDNLLEVLIETIKLDGEKIQSMRNEVIKYYDQYLTSTSNVIIFDHAKKNKNEVYFIDEVHEFGRDS